MVTVVRKWGNSLGIRLPKTVAQEVEIDEGASVVIEARDGQIVITAAHKRRYCLSHLVRGITPKNRHAAVDTGDPRGKEAW
jgi:antitoxin MazE